MNAKDLYTNLKKFYNFNFNKYNLLSPLFILDKDGSRLTWFNYTPKESFYSYDEYFQWVVNNNQYSLTIDEEVLIQIYYEEKDKSVTRGSLSFLPKPDSYMGYFRFDLDIDKRKDYYHNSYHGNFGYNTDYIRFSVYKFPYPSEFLKFVLFLLKKNTGLKHLSKQNFFQSLSELKENYNHFFDLINN